MSDELIGTRVRVHYNLTRRDWVVCTDTSKRTTLARAEDVTLKDVTFKISEASRQRNIRTGQRDVHAQAVGTLVSVDAGGTPEGERISYNPFKAPTFYVCETGEPVTHAAQVTFHGRGTATAQL